MPSEPSETFSSAAFAQKANSYDHYAQVQAEAASWLAQWLPVDAGAETCLELGAGTGFFSQYLPELFQKITCTDLSEEMLQVLQTRVPAAECQVLNAWQPATHSQQGFDYVVASSLLQWAPDPVTNMQSWCDRLTPDGRILAGFFVDPSLPELQQILSGSGPINWKTPEAWVQIFESAGLQVLRMEADTHEYQYSTALEFWKSLHGTGATISKRMQPSQMLRLFREYTALFPELDGVLATWTFCRVELQKASAVNL